MTGKAENLEKVKRTLKQIERSLEKLETAEGEERKLWKKQIEMLSRDIITYVKYL